MYLVFSLFCLYTTWKGVPLPGWAGAAFIGSIIVQCSLFLNLVMIACLPKLVKSECCDPCALSPEP